MPARHSHWAPDVRAALARRPCRYRSAASVLIMIPTRHILGLRLRSLWSFLVAQDLAYWATCCYLFVEYVRPQQIVRPLSYVPVGRIVLGAALLAQVGSRRPFAIKGLGSWLLLAFTAVILVSSLTAYRSDVAIGKWWLWFSWVIIYFLIVNVVNTEQRLAFFTLLWLLFHYYMSQGGVKQFALRGFTFAEWGVVGAPGWFNNSGEFGIAMCMFLAVAWHYYLGARAHLATWRKVIVLGMPVTAIVAIIGSSSRGAVLGLAAVGAWSVLRGKHRLRTALGVVVLAAGVWLLLPQEQKTRFSTAGEDYTSRTRKTYWRNGLDMVREHPVLGVGYGNWLTYYRDHYLDVRATSGDPQRAIALPHNVFIECMAELGYVGLSAFVLLIAATFLINYRTRNLARARASPPHAFAIQMAYGLDGALVGYLVSGFFVTVLYYPFFWMNLAFTTALNVIARRNHGEHTAGVVAPTERRTAVVRYNKKLRPRSR